MKPVEKSVERGKLHAKRLQSRKKIVQHPFFNMGDLEGVVTLGVARAQKCIFPIRGARFSRRVPPHVHKWECTWPEAAKKWPEAAKKWPEVAEKCPK